MSIIEQGSLISKTSRVWHFSTLRKGCLIDEDCNIGSYVYIDSDVKVGKGCKIQNFSCLYSGVILEPYVFIGPRVTFTNVKVPRAFIERKNEFQTTLIRQGASIGAACTVVCGITVGEYAVVGAGSLVCKNIGSHELWFGAPASKKGYVTRYGELLELPPIGEVVSFQCKILQDTYCYSHDEMISVSYDKGV